MSASHEGASSGPVPNSENSDGFVVDNDAAVRAAAAELAAVEAARRSVRAELPDMSDEAADRLLATRATNEAMEAKGRDRLDYIDYPDGLKDEEKPADYANNPEVAADWNARRQAFASDYSTQHKTKFKGKSAEAAAEFSEVAEKAKMARAEKRRKEKEELERDRDEQALKAINEMRARETADTEASAAKAEAKRVKEELEAAKKEADEAKQQRDAARKLAQAEIKSRSEAEALAAEHKRELGRLATERAATGTRERPIGTPPPLPESDVPFLMPINTRSLERPTATDDMLSERARHAEGSETPPVPTTDPVEATDGRPGPYDLDPRRVRPDAAGVPPNTPPSAGARAYAAGLMNKPTIKGRILSGLAWPFKKIGKGIAEVGNWAGFHFDRAYDNVAMNLQDGKTDRAAAKFEAEKAGFEVAKAKTLNIQEAIAAIDKEKEENKEFITPKIAKRMERARRDLEMKLIEAQEDQDQSLRKIKLHEGRTIAHENKRTEIARHYAELVDNRMRPKREAQQALQERKAQYEEEIKAWSEKVASNQEKIAAIEARAKKNPYCKSAFKGQLKAAQKMLAASQKEVEKRRNKITGAFGIDSGMFRDNLVDINDTLQKWDNNKATYSRIADRKITQYDKGAYIGSTPAENIAYRNPVENVAVPAGTYSEEGTRAREAALESAPTSYGIDEWVKQWNALNGSKLRLDAESLVDADVLRNYRDVDNPGINVEGFAGIVKIFLRKPGVAEASTLKAPAVTKLARQALESLREKAADAAMARETTA